jgi:hypothetical protein
MKLNLFFLSAAALVSAATAVDSVDLGRAGDYVILAKSGIVAGAAGDLVANAITGDIGVSPIALTAITGLAQNKDAAGQFASSEYVTGVIHAADFGGDTASALTTAVGAMEVAYTDAAGRANTQTTATDTNGDTVALANVTGDLTGLTLSPGVYTFDVDVSFTGLTLQGTSPPAGSDPDVFIIRTSKTLKASGNVVLTGGAKAENIFWQVAEEVEVAAGVTFEGILLAKEKVDLLAGVALNGRVLTQKACTIGAGTTITEPAAAAVRRRSLRGKTLL